MNKKFDLIQQDPMADIRIKPLITDDGTKSRARAVLLDTGKKGKGKYKEVGVVGEKYYLISNKKLVQDVVNPIIDRTDNNFNLSKEFFNGSRWQRFYVADDLTIPIESVDKGDYIKAGFYVQNSYDGSSPVRMGIYGEKVACKNGQLSKEYLPSVRITHNLSNKDLYESEIDKLVQLVTQSKESLLQMVKASSLMKNSLIDINGIAHLRMEYLNKIPTSTFGKVMDQFLPLTYGDSEVEWTVSDFYDCFTNVLWHNKNMTQAHIDQNSYVTDQMIKFANLELTDEAMV